MQYTADNTFNRKLFAGASCAFGVFDGLHQGHRYLIDQSVASAHTADDACGCSIILTFDIDPDEVFHPNRLKKLMRNADRLAALEQTGADAVVILPFTHDLFTLEPDEFLETTFSAGVPAHLHVGENFRFGAKAAGTVETLRRWGTRVGCRIHAHGLVSSDGKPITATRIRLLLQDCKLREATTLLGHPYSLRETVQRGRGEGTGFGFATANLQVKPHDRVLGEGVYAAWATIGNARYKAAVSVGVSPTFEASANADMEAHILDFNGDLIGRDITLEFVEYLRPMIKFDSTEELIATVTANIDWIRENLQ